MTLPARSWDGRGAGPVGTGVRTLMLPTGNVV